MPKDDWEGNEFKGWTVHERLGRGGNGVVHRATRADQQGAIKILKSDLWTGKRYKRFAHEIEGMRRCEGIPGVIPLLDFNAPEKPSNADPPWIVMGLATPLTDALGKKPKLEQVVEACLEIAETLAAMHAIDLWHRDIKPDNLFKFRDRWAIGDFGLIDFDDKTNVTAEGERLGPAYYIAPEMLNNADTADGQAADVYSFAKTLWVLATGQRFPLPGEMRRTDPAFTISAYVQHSRAPLLDPVIEAATSNDPAKRSKMKDIASELKAWLYPHVSPNGADEPDLSMYAGEVAGMLARAKALQEESNERIAYAQREGYRVRELLRPYVQGIVEPLQRGGFSPSVNIDNYVYGFQISSRIREIPGIRETNLQLTGGIHIGLDGRADVRFSGDILVPGVGGSKQITYELWKDSATFLLGGSEEKPAIEKVFAELKAQLPRFVERMLGIAKDTESDKVQDGNLNLELKDATSLGEVVKILESAESSPKVTLTALAVEIEKELREIIFSEGQIGKPYNFTTLNAINILEERGALPTYTLQALHNFSRMRNKIADDRSNVTSDDILSAIDSGSLILSSLKPIHRLRVHVRHPGVTVHSDQECTQPIENARGVILEMVNTKHGNKDIGVYPSTRIHFVKGKQVAWEWDDENQWGAAWYRDPDTNEIKSAWGNSLEFVGRNLEDT